MNVAQLKKALENFPDHMEVILKATNHDFTYYILEDVRQQTVRFCEDEAHPNREPFCDEECVVLAEDTD